MNESPTLLCHTCFLSAPAINWARNPSSVSGAGIKPTGIADVYSKFRPVKRVSPLKHQPEVSDAEADGKNEERRVNVSVSLCDAQGLKSRAGGTGALFGDLEHYDLDMDEILDVPYIKSSQQVATLPRVASEKKTSGSACFKGASLTHAESLSGTQFWPDIRKSKSTDLGFERSVGSDSDRLFSDLPFPDTPTHKAGSPGDCPANPPHGAKGTRQDKSWSGSRAFGELDEETKRSQNIMNVVREGQISLLVRG